MYLQTVEQIIFTDVNLTVTCGILWIHRQVSTETHPFVFDRNSEQILIKRVSLLLVQVVWDFIWAEKILIYVFRYA